MEIIWLDIVVHSCGWLMQCKYKDDLGNYRGTSAIFKRPQVIALPGVERPIDPFVELYEIVRT